MASLVALKEAQEHLGELLERAELGEEIVIERHGRPAMRIVPALNQIDGERAAGSNLLNSARGQVWFAEDWDSPETNAEIADLFENSKLFPEISAE